MSKRTVYFVSWNPPTREWSVREKGGGTLMNLPNKAQAVSFARTQALAQERAQVIVRKKDSRIQIEYTYPRSSDPRRHKG